MFIFYKETYKSQWSDIVLPSSILVISILIGTTLMSTIFNFESGIEKLFIEEDVQAILTTVPGRPSIGTMMNFSLIGIMAIFSVAQWQYRKIIYFVFGIIIMIVSVSLETHYTKIK